jgi:hypothetical protein
MTKERVALPFRFDGTDDEQQVPPLRYASGRDDKGEGGAPPTRDVDAARAIVGFAHRFSPTYAWADVGHPSISCCDAMKETPLAIESGGHVLLGMGLIWRLHRVAIWTHIFSEIARCTRNSLPRM